MVPVTNDPRIRLLYLVAIAVGIFVTDSLALIGALCGLQVVLWHTVGLTFRSLLRQLKKLALYLGVICIAYSLVTHDPSTDTWSTYLVLGLELRINHSGALVGMMMCLRIVAIVLASQLIRTHDARAIAAGLRQIGVPQIVAMSIDAVLALIGTNTGKKTDRGRRRQGTGRGGKKRSFWKSVQKLAKGDASVIVAPLFRHIERVKQHLSHEDDSPKQRQLIADVAVISGIALTMLGVKALKLLPGLPFAPGHKGVILIPLYIAAGFITRSRFGATFTGLTMGVAAFMLGDGRYGIFEIAKHVAPGIVVDMLMPFLRSNQRRNSILLWCLFGVLIAMGRFATVTLIALTVQAPALVFALLLPGLTIHAIFGVLSGLISRPVIRILAQSPDINDDGTKTSRQE